MTHDAPPILQVLDRNISALSSSAKNIIGDNIEHQSKQPVGKKSLSILNEISLESRKLLKRRYAEEFRLFGYSFDENTNTLGCSINDNDRGKCC